MREVQVKFGITSHICIVSFKLNFFQIELELESFQTFFTFILCLQVPALLTCFIYRHQVAAKCSPDKVTFQAFRKSQKIWNFRPGAYRNFISTVFFSSIIFFPVSSRFRYTIRGFPRMKRIIQCTWYVFQNCSLENNWISPIYWNAFKKERYKLQFPL